MNTNQNQFQTKEITINDLDSILSYWAIDKKNVLISVKDPFVHQHILKEMDCRIYSNDIFIDGENSIATCLIIPIEKIVKIIQLDNDEIEIVFSDNIKMNLSIIKSKFSLWLRKTMNRNWDNGKMYLYN
jgi:hypothetical protein